MKNVKKKSDISYIFRYFVFEISKFLKLQHIYIKYATFAKNKLAILAHFGPVIVSIRVHNSAAVVCKPCICLRISNPSVWWSLKPYNMVRVWGYTQLIRCHHCQFDVLNKAKKVQFKSIITHLPSPFSSIVLNQQDLASGTSSCTAWGPSIDRTACPIRSLWRFIWISILLICFCTRYNYLWYFYLLKNQCKHMIYIDLVQLIFSSHFNNILQTSWSLHTVWGSAIFLPSATKGCLVSPIPWRRIRRLESHPSLDFLYAAERMGEGKSSALSLGFCLLIPAILSDTLIKRRQEGAERESLEKNHWKLSCDLRSCLTWMTWWEEAALVSNTLLHG